MPRISGGKFVILGGASQVGSHIAEQLLAAGVGQLVLLDNLSLGSSDAVNHLLADPRCTFVRGDLLRLNELLDPLEGAEGAFHVVGFMANSISQDPWTGLDVNVRGLQNALEACRIRGVKKVVFSSSVGVYGSPQDSPTVESSNLRWQEAPPAMAVYGATKVIGESLLRMYRERCGLDYVALRYSAVYGERQHRRALMGGGIADACERIRQGLPPLIEGSGEQVQDYIHVADVARANLMAMESDVCAEAMNICAGFDVSRNRVMEILLKACGSDLQPEHVTTPGKASLPPSGRLGYDNEKARRLLGWAPQVSIEEGVDRVRRWCDAQHASRN